LHQMRCPLVGVTRQDLLLETIALEDHDVKMTHLVDETGVFVVLSS
jgi:5-formyltetrahydrofolate cyclo-ligase